MEPSRDVVVAECPCGQAHEFASQHAGRVARCPKLNRQFRVPSRSGPVVFLEESVPESGASEDKTKDGTQPNGVGSSLVKRARELYQAQKEKRELYKTTHCRCPHCKAENETADFMCKRCGCPLHDQQAAFLFMEKRRQEQHEIELARLQATQAKAASRESRGAPSQPKDAVLAPTMNIQQTVVVERQQTPATRRQPGCLSVIGGLAVLIVMIVICAGLLNSGTPADHANPQVAPVNSQAEPTNPSLRVPGQVKQEISPAESQPDNGDKSADPELRAAPVQRPASATPLESPASLPVYEIVDRVPYDSPVKTQIELHAVVSGAATESGLRLLLQKLYDEARVTGGFKFHDGKPTHVFIYLYTSHEHFKSGWGQWIAMLSKLGEDSEINAEVKTELISQPIAKPQVKRGLSESKRQEVFRAIVAAEDRADKDAHRMYPLPDARKPGYSQAKARAQLDKQLEARNSLTNKYKAEIAKENGVAEEQLREISLEGIKKNWPVP